MSRILSPDAAPTCLITGMAGVGKSTLAKELWDRNRLAFDADDIPNLGSWFDNEGNKQVYNPDKEWRRQHKFFWDINMVADILIGRPQDKPIYIAGTSHNTFLAARMFDFLLVLVADVDTLFVRRNLSTRVTPYPFETEPEDLVALEANTQLYQKTVHDLGMIAIDAWYPVVHIADEVTRIVEENLDSQSAYRT